MDNLPVDIDRLINCPDFDPDDQGARFWYEAYLDHQQRLEQTQAELEKFKKM